MSKLYVHYIIKPTVTPIPQLGMFIIHSVFGVICNLDLAIVCKNTVRCIPHPLPPSITLILSFTSSLCIIDSYSIPSLRITSFLSSAHQHLKRVTLCKCAVMCILRSCVVL